MLERQRQERGAGNTEIGKGCWRDIESKGVLVRQKQERGAEKTKTGKGCSRDREERGTEDAKAGKG